MLTSRAAGLVQHQASGLRDYREDPDMAFGDGAANHYADGAQNPDPAPNQKGHAEMGGETNSASTGRNDPLPGVHPLTGTELPSRSGGDGNVMRGGRGRGN